MRGNIQEQVNVDFSAFFPPVKKRTPQRRHAFVKLFKSKVKKAYQTRKAELEDEGIKIERGDNTVFYTVVAQMMTEATDEQLQAVEAEIASEDPSQEVQTGLYVLQHLVWSVWLIHRLTVMP